MRGRREAPFDVRATKQIARSVPPAPGAGTGLTDRHQGGERERAEDAHGKAKKGDREGKGGGGEWNKKSEPDVVFALVSSLYQTWPLRREHPRAINAHTNHARAGAP